MKIDIVKVANVAGVVLGIAGTILTSWAGHKTAQINIAKEVAEQLAKK